MPIFWRPPPRETASGRALNFRDSPKYYHGKKVGEYSALLEICQLEISQLDTCQLPIVAQELWRSSCGPGIVVQE